MRRPFRIIIIVSGFFDFVHENRFVTLGPLRHA